ncbi:MAG: MFS transporter [Clostridia bacterium]|nr:MFS transporter [Clostridia bacterium]
MQIIEKVKGAVVGFYDEIVLHWNRPAKGNYVSYKELVNYAVGGVGKNLVLYLMTYMALSASNTLIGSTIGIRPLHLQYMSIIQTLAGIFFAMIRGKWVDNTRTRMGKFRPFIAFMGIPLVVMALIYLFLPFEQMTYNDKLIWTFVFALCISMFQPLLVDTYTELGSVITPNSNERARLLTISILIASFAPTVYNFIVPLILNWTGLTYTNIETYRYIVASFAVLGVGFNLFAAFGCRERVITSKSYNQKVGLIEGMVGIYKNKYWWIKQIATIIGFLESSFSVIFGWMYIYGTQDMVQYSLLTTVYGTASTIAMVITPLLLRKLGNRGILLFHNVANIGCLSIMFLVYKNPFLFFCCMYLNAVFNQLQLVYDPVLNAEVKDYQQFLTGKRVDFLLGSAATITVPITLCTGLVIPFVYEAMGITTNYDILYDPQVRNNMFNMLCMLSIIGSILNLVPFFFYRLSREKHTMIVQVLRRRAAFTDYANGSITPEQVVETVESHRAIQAIIEAEEPNMKDAREAIKNAYAVRATTPEQKKYKKDAIKSAFKAYEEARHIKANKEAYREIYLKEENKFEVPSNALLLEIAKKVKEYTPSEIRRISFEEFNIAKPEDKKLLALYNKEIKRYNKMIAEINRVYGDNIPTDCYEKVEAAHAIVVDDIKDKVAIKARDKAIDVAEKALIKFNEVFGYYNAKLELIAESENRLYYPEIEAMYEEALAEIARKDEEIARKDAEERERKKQELIEAKQARFDSFSDKKKARILARRQKAEAKKAQKAMATQSVAMEEVASADEQNEGGNE